MRVHPVTWSFRVLWLSLPFTLGDALGVALRSHSSEVGRLVTVAAWIGWGLVLAMSAVPRPATLTGLRFAAPASIPLAVWVCIDADIGGLAAVGLATAAICGVLACTAWVADDCVDGSSYGDERRWSLRAPGLLVIGPIPLAWAVGVAGIGAGPLLIATASGSTAHALVGVLVTVVGVVAAVASLRSLHTLSIRCAVMVPAGMTLVDPLTLGESVLFSRARMRHLGPAYADTTALDLSQRALGLAVQVDMTEPVEFLRRDARRHATEVTSSSVTFTPGRAGALLADAAERRLPVS